MDLPSRLYKYQRVSATSLQNLKFCKLWFSAPASFNDPFDCALKVIREPEVDLERVWAHLEARSEIDPSFAASMRPDGEFSDEFRRSTLDGIRNAFERQRHENLYNRGVACFSTKNDDILMWSHYADGHRGFCLEFNTQCDPFNRARPVHYASEVPALDPVDYLEYDATKRNPLESMMQTKSACWEYEAEWRLIHMQANLEYSYDFRALTGVYFGSAMPEEQMSVIAQLLLGAPTKLFRMRARELEFSVASEPVDYVPFDYAGGEPSA